MSNLTDKQRKEFEALADAMIKYLNDNHNLNTKIIIDSSSAEIVSGVRSYLTERHWKD